MFKVCANHQGARGVTYERHAAKWRARLYVDGRHVTLGRFSSKMLAAQMHDAAAFYVFGDDAVTNDGLIAARKHMRRLLDSEGRRGFCIERLKRLKAQYQFHQLANATRGAGPAYIRAHRGAAATLAVLGGLSGANAAMPDDMRPDGWRRGGMTTRVLSTAFLVAARL